MTKKRKTNSSFMYFIFTIALFGGIVAIWLYFSTFCTSFKNCSVLPDIEIWGQTGDFFGGVLNPFFTLVGLFFVISTIKQNQQALEQSEIELQLSRAELKKSNEALQSQVITAEKQRFETTFFQLLSLFNEVVRDFCISDTLKGKSAVVWLYKEGLTKYVRVRYQKGSVRLNIEDINFAYGEFYDQYGYLLTSYLRTLHSLIAFVDNSKLSNEEKNFYSSLVIAQLSKFELGLLFYICLLQPPHAYGEFLPLVKKYNILRHLEDNSLISLSHRALLNTEPTEEQA